jgi:hypothetical protein
MVRFVTSKLDSSEDVAWSSKMLIGVQSCFDERHTRGWIALPVDSSASKEERIITANICEQLAQSQLIDWRSVGSEPMAMGRITSRGVDVVEGNATPPIAITIGTVESRQYSVHGSSNAQIGDGNVQDVTFRGERIIAAINNAEATEREKEKAKSLLQSVLDNPLLNKILGGHG